MKKERVEAYARLMEWLDGLREATDSDIGECTDSDYALIFDQQGVSWSTETLESGEQVKSVNHGWHALIT